MNNGVKLTRSQLKSMVKECLVEILQEGLGSIGPIKQMSSMDNYSQYSEGKQPKHSGIHGNLTRPKSASLDTPVTKKQDKFASSLAETIRQESRGNPMMADILADTAMTTLPKMMSSGDSSGKYSGGSSPRTIQVEHFSGSPEDVFGDEVASKWANLAFMESPNKKIS
jgi:hypothetical protein